MIIICGGINIILLVHRILMNDSYFSFFISMMGIDISALIIVSTTMQGRILCSPSDICSSTILCLMGEHKVRPYIVVIATIPFGRNKKILPLKNSPQKTTRTLPTILTFHTCFFHNSWHITTSQPHSS
ncbi:membrane protein [Candidatus Magnetomorum sp. HK-1]|nr:membrane protein [Candidatus Magnetomorum sp. HK-1]